MTLILTRLSRLLLVAATCGPLSIFLTSCETTGGGGNFSNHPAVKGRAAAIAAEPRGDYWIGRRWFTEGTRFWGYLRRPGQPWSSSKLVLMNESVTRIPDRVPEDPTSGPRHGFDHNYEYRISGSFTGDEGYDPNSNLVLPEFRPTKFELVSSKPGFLFQPGERYNPKRLPPKIPPVPR